MSYFEHKIMETAEHVNEEQETESCYQQLTELHTKFKLTTLQGKYVVVLILHGISVLQLES